MREPREGQEWQKNLPSEINHHQTPFSTVVNALKLSQIQILPLPSGSIYASHQACTAKTPSLISMPRKQDLHRQKATCFRWLKIWPIPHANTVASKVRFPIAEKKKMQRQILSFSNSFLLSKSFAVRLQTRPQTFCFTGTSPLLLCQPEAAVSELSHSCCFLLGHCSYSYLNSLVGTSPVPSKDQTLQLLCNKRSPKEALILLTPLMADQGHLHAWTSLLLGWCHSGCLHVHDHWASEVISYVTMLEAMLNSQRHWAAADGPVFCHARRLPGLTMTLRWHKALQGRDVLGNQRPAHLGLEGNDSALKHEARTSPAFLWPPALGYSTADTGAINPFKRRMEAN